MRFVLPIPKGSSGLRAVGGTKRNLLMKIKNYGELCAWYTRKPLLAYVEFGSYQGEYIAVVDDGDDIALYKGYYGSCSGCDWLEDARDWRNDDNVPESEALEFAAKEFSHSFAAIPKETVMRVDSDTFAAMLPANVRGDIYEFDAAELHSAIKSGIENQTK